MSAPSYDPTPATTNPQVATNPVADAPGSPARPELTPEERARKAHDELFPPGPDGQPAARSREFHGSTGRFAMGNPGGPGNPYARKAAEFKKRFQACVKQEDIDLAYEKIAEGMRAGDKFFTKLFMEYVVGKTKKEVEPDRVDAHEWHVAKETVVTSGELAEVMGAPLMKNNLMQTRMFRPLLSDLKMNEFATMIRDGKLPGTKPAPGPELDIAILDRPAPFPEGPIGDALKANIQGPHVPKARRSPIGNGANGRNGDRPPIGNGANGADPSQVSLFGTNPSTNGKKKHKHAKSR